MEVWLTPGMARRILAKRPPYSLDLGRSFTWQAPGISGEVLEEVAAQEKGVFYYNGKKLVKLEIRAEHYYKLEGMPPVLWIDGIKMHEGEVLKRAEETTRFAEGRVLDICTGLGYSAIAASKRAEEVITVEKDPNVLLLARYNPWSRELFENPVIKIALADAFELVKKLSKPFDFIHHDPPRFSLAGELYSLAFYRELYRLLKPRGLLYHYTGAPGAARGKKIREGISRRLKQAGFKIIREDGYGFLAAKVG